MQPMAVRHKGTTQKRGASWTLAQKPPLAYMAMVVVTVVIVTVRGVGFKEERPNHDGHQVADATTN